MKRLLVAIAAAVLLASCNSAADIEESFDNVNANLPEGCTASYAGRILRRAESFPVVVVVCDGRQATATTTAYRTGKTTHYATTVVIES